MKARTERRRRGRARRGAIATTLGLVLALAAGAARAQPDGAGAAEPRPADLGELLVELLDADGRPLPEVAPADLEVVEEGEPRPVAAVEPVGEWRVVIYLDLLLTEPSVTSAALYELAARAPELTALGPVEVVVAGETVRQALPPTREPLALEEALAWIRVRETPEAAPLALRRRFVDELERSGALDSEGDRATAAQRLAAAAELARQAVADEALVLAEHRSLMLDWLVDRGGGGTRVLLVAGGAHDLRPEAFYRSLLAGTELGGALDGVAVAPGGPTQEEVARTAAVYGWVVLPFSPPPGADPLITETPEEARARDEAERVETEIRDGRLVDRVVTPQLDVARLLRRRGARGEVAVAALLEPYGPLDLLAAATGGEVLHDRLELGDALARLADRRRVRFEPGDRPPASLRRLEVRRADGGALPRKATIRARAWSSETTPEPAAASRVRRFLDDELDEGALFASASLAAPQAAERGRLTVRFDTARLPTVERPLRLTVAVAGAGQDDPVRVTHRLIPTPAADAGPEGGTAVLATDDEGWRTVSLDLELPAGGDVPVAVVVEETDTGRWGAAYATTVVATAPDDAAPADLYLPAPKAIHLMAPREAMVMGRQTFDTVVSEHRVARVDFYLDGRKVASSFAPPFAASVDLGRLPSTHLLEAVAYDAAGEEIDRDTLTVNEGTGSFRVRIVDPRSEAEREGRVQVVGPVTVRAEVETPRGSRVERVDFYWRDELVGTRFAAPYVHRVTVPEAAPKGFVRVVGRLADGSTAEDVLVLNTPGSTERVEVDLVELYVVVTDRRGRPLKGLERGQFRVEEEGERQELATFGDASDQPITVGLVIDSSASMFVKLPDVQQAASTYLQGLVDRKDRAFVVGFGSEPRLARDTTADLDQAIRGLYRLEPDGQTAIWKAVVYSLVQLQGVPGKKALIVYSDGADEDPDFSYRTCLDFARRVGVPIYFIVSNDEIARTEGKSLNVRGFLGRLRNLTREVGGKVFLTRVNEDLEGVYREIDEELRSQYVLGYYAQNLGGETWRRVEVDVGRPGAVVRTIAGYYR